MANPFPTLNLPKSDATKTVSPGELVRLAKKTGMYDADDKALVGALESEVTKGRAQRITMTSKAVVYAFAKGDRWVRPYRYYRLGLDQPE